MAKRTIGAKVDRTKNVLMIGNFPPPMGGAAKNTQLIYEFISPSIETIKLDTSQYSIGHSKSVFRYIQKVTRFLKTLSRLFINIRNKYKDTVIYIVPDGGYGFIFSYLYISASKLFGKNVILHHRTTQYLSSNRNIITLLMRRTLDCHHVFLSAGMRTMFRAKYGSPKSSSVSNNAVYVPAISIGPIEQQNTLTIGYISNLAAEKGFTLLVDLMLKAKAASLDIQYVIAGRPVSSRERSLLDYLMMEFGDRLTYLGHIEGDEKLNFFGSIDIMVFPTIFAQEAQPNVVYEALSHNVFPICSDKGLIAEMLPDHCKCYPASKFVTNTTRDLQHFLRDRKSLLKNRKSVQKDFRDISAKSIEQFDAFCHLLTRL